MGHTLSVGDRFTQRTERAYRLEDGTRRQHVRVDEWRVTVTDEIGLVAEYEGTIEEHDRPAFAGYPMERSMAWFGVDAAIARGDLHIITED